MHPSGRYKHKLGFYRRDTTSDGHGTPEPIYRDAPEFVVFGNLQARFGGEGIAAGRLEGRSFVNVTVRQSANTRQVNSDWHVKDEIAGTVYKIVADKVDPNAHNADRGREFEMLCETPI